MSTRKAPFENHLSYVLAAAHRAVNRSMTKCLKDLGIQVEAWRIMEALEANDRLSMGELAGIALLNPPTLSKMVDRMVSNGLVHRQLASEDQRQVNLLLTDLGRGRMLKVRSVVETHDRALFNQIDQKDGAALLELLKRINTDAVH